MKEVILKIGMQGSFSQIINNVGKLILKEFLNPIPKKKKKVIQEYPLAETSFILKYVCLWACMYVSVCTCLFACECVGMSVCTQVFVS